MIAVVDYGMGNLRSVQKALQRVGADARIVHAPEQIARADKVVVPGVGAFRDAIERIRSAALDAPIREAIGGGKPFLGICLGLQMLFDVSYEDGEFAGLGILPGKVVRFDFAGRPDAAALRVPQIGWNGIRWDRSVPILKGLEQGAHVYFCHSYFAQPADAAIVAATTEYGIPFASAVWKDNVFATQFHPEKSQAVGLTILENFVRL
ncbi:MAG: imidazole glycerol phosphate synthase subunit HisH [Phycisphaerae bacterium]